MILVVLLAAVLALLPMLLRRDDLINLAFMVLLYICLGQSWNMLSGFAGQTNLGHSAFFGIGALVTRWLWATLELPVMLAMILGGLAAAAFAMVIGVPTFRLRGAYFAIGMLALGEMMHAVIAQVLPFNDTLPVQLIAGYSLAMRYYVALILTIIILGFSTWLLRKPISLGLFAVREDEDAARASGVNPLYHKLFALALSSFFGGVTGGLYAYHQVSYYPQSVFGGNWTLDALLITYIGGLGTVIGPVVGSLFFVALRELFSSIFASFNLVVFGALFIVIVLAFPGGLVELLRKFQRGR
ncbi:MAG: branched-chain amino acid ABC transporter permease [Anaerolineae bacterium]|nr:branched-chain amino acid ABC transporter permease [Anaerolineae bacterium]